MKTIAGDRKRFCATKLSWVEDIRGETLVHLVHIFHTSYTSHTSHISRTSRISALSYQQRNVKNVTIMAKSMHEISQGPAERNYYTNWS